MENVSLSEKGGRVQTASIRVCTVIARAAIAGPAIFAALVAASHLTTQAVYAQSPPAVGAKTETTRLDYRIEPLVDLYNYVRALATQRGDPEVPAEFAQAVAAAKKLREKLGLSILAWGTLDQNLLSCKSASDLKRAFEALPQEIPVFRGKPVAIRAEAICFAEELAAVESLYLEQQWPTHQAAIRAAMQRIEQQFQPKEAECLSFMVKSLGMPDPKDVVPIYLVQQASWPGAFTFRRADGGGVCFVSVGRAEHAGSLLFETILHEATHALDGLTRDTGSILIELRRKLQAAGMSPSDRDFRNIPHTLMFIQAGETIRRMVNPRHKHYGDAAGYYGKMGRIVVVERPLWIEYLDGKLTREAAVHRIVATLVEKGDD